MSAVFACIVQAKVIEFSVADHKLHRAQKDEELLQELLALSLPPLTSGDPQADTATPPPSQPNQQQPPKQQQQQQVKEGTSKGMASSKAGSKHPQAAAAAGGGGDGFEMVTQAGGGCRVLWGGNCTSMASVGTAVCVFEGKLSNAKPLAEAYAPVSEEGEEEEGGEAGAGKGTRGLVSAAELVCHMYGKVGVDLLGLLRGTFTFVLYESKTGRVLAARDGCGVCPLFQSRTRCGSLALSNSQQLLEGLGGGGAGGGLGAGGEAAGGDNCGGSELLEILPGDYKYGWSAVPRRYQPPDRRSSFQSHPIGSPSTPSAHWPIHNRSGSRRTSLDQHAHPHSPNGQRFRPTDSVSNAVASPIVSSAPTFGSGGGGGSLGAHGAPRGRSSMDQHRPTHPLHKSSTDGTAHVTGAGVGSPAAAVAAGTAASPHHPHGHQHHHPQSAPHRTYVVSADGLRIRKVPKKNASGNKSQQQQQQHSRQQHKSGSDSGGVAGPSAAAGAAAAGGVVGGGSVSALSAALAAASVSDRSNPRAAAADARGGGRVASSGRHGGQGEGGMNAGGGAGGGGNNRRRSTEVQNGGWRTGAGSVTQSQVVTQNGSVSSGAHQGRRQFGGQQQHQGQQSVDSAAPQSSAKQPQQKNHGGQQQKPSEQLNGTAAAATAAPIWIGKAGSSTASGGGGGDSIGGGVWKAKVGSPANGGGGGGARVRSGRGAATVAATAAAAGRDDVSHSAGVAPLSSPSVGSLSHSVSSGGSVNEPGRKGRKSKSAHANKNGNHAKHEPGQQCGPQQLHQQQQGGGAQLAATDRMSRPPLVSPELRKPEGGVASQCGGGGEGVAVAASGGGSGAGGLRVEAPEFKPQWGAFLGAPTAMGRAPAAAAVVGAVEGLMAVAGASM